MNSSRRRYLTLSGSAIAAMMAGCQSSGSSGSEPQDGSESGEPTNSEDGTASGQVTVKELRVPSSVEVGEAFTATVTVANGGNQEDTYAGTLAASGACVSGEHDVEVSVGGGETSDVDVELPEPECDGDLRLEIGDQDVSRTVTVSPYPTPRSAVHDHRYTETNVGVTDDPGPSAVPEAVQAYENAISPVLRMNGDAIAMVSATSTVGRGSVQVLDPDGSERWTDDLQFANTEPALFEERLYVVDANDLVCYDVATGDVLWTFTEAGPPSDEVTYTEMYGTPLVSGGTVYFNGMHGRVWAVNAYSGRKEWSTWLTPDEETNSISGIPAVKDGTLYVVGSDGVGRSDRGPLFALDADTGEAQWQSEEETLVGGTTPVRSGHVYVRTLVRDGMWPTETIRAYETDSGTVAWETEVENLNSDPVVDGDRVYVGRSWPSSNASGELVALDSSSGEVDWRMEPSAGIVDPPGVGANGLFVMDWEDTLYSIAPSSGTVNWTAEDLAHRTTPTIYDDRLYLVDAETNVVTAYA